MKLSAFQIILLIVAGISIIVAVLMFAFRRSDPEASGAPVTLWGVMDAGIFTELKQRMQQTDVNISNIGYVQKDPLTIEEEFVQALAEGTGPDIIMISQDQIIPNEKRLITIPYESFPLRNFKDTFIEESDLYLKEEGILGIPFTVDPLIMYWNQTLFQKEGISVPPRFWDEVMSITPRLSQKDSSFNLQKSAVAMGEFQNIDHAKEILLTLILQAGNNVIVRQPNVTEELEFKSILNERLGFTVTPAHAALNFFTQFSNPSKEVYSWNRALSRSQDRFIAGDLAMYFGFASELPVIQKKNPNLSFDVALMPQSRNGQNRNVFGQMQALALSRNTANTQSAFAAIVSLSNPEVQSELIAITNLPSVRRDLLQADPGDQFQSVFFTSALWSKGVLDIDRNETEGVLQRMVESFSTGRLDVNEAVNRANSEINLLFGSR